MSHDIYLRDAEGNTVHFDEPHTLNGGTYALGGTTEAWLNITYNYTRFYEMLPEGSVTGLYGMKAADAIPVLESAVGLLGTMRDQDYWKSTAGNAGAALNDLLTLCRLAPTATIQGD